MFRLNPHVTFVDQTCLSCSSLFHFVVNDGTRQFINDRPSSLFCNFCRYQNKQRDVERERTLSESEIEDAFSIVTIITELPSQFMSESISLSLYISVSTILCQVQKPFFVYYMKVYPSLIVEIKPPLLYPKLICINKKTIRRYRYQKTLFLFHL